MSGVQYENLHTQDLLSPNSNIEHCGHNRFHRSNIFYFFHEPGQLSARYAVVRVDSYR